MYAIGMLVVLIIFELHILFELYITRKYQKTLDTPPQFIPVRQTDPPRPAGPRLSLAGVPPQMDFMPPPPYNPQYVPTTNPAVTSQKYHQ